MDLRYEFVKGSLGPLIGPIIDYQQALHRYSPDSVAELALA